MKILVRFSYSLYIYKKYKIVFGHFYQAQNMIFKMFIIFTCICRGEEALVKVILPHASTQNTTKEQAE